MNKPDVTGRALSLFVSDPWDFGTEHGTGPFKSAVVGRSEHALLLKLIEPFAYANEMWAFLAATPRLIRPS